MKLIERNGKFICCECGKEFSGPDKERAARDSLFCAQQHELFFNRVTQDISKNGN